MQYGSVIGMKINKLGRKKVVFLQTVRLPKSLAAPIGAA